MKKIDDIPRTTSKDIDPELLKLCQKVTAKRAKTVISHILRHGIITNEDLSQIYNYDHPPRAIRDVRENGIPLVTHRVLNEKTQRTMGAYTFDDVSKIKKGRIGGRIAFPKKLKKQLVEKYDSRDAFSRTRLDARYLQIDHRIPYEVAGNEADISNLDEFMLLDSSSQRAKSWSCENCNNFTTLKLVDNCKGCFWAYPENYSHVALKEERRLVVKWQGEEVDKFEKLSKQAERLSLPTQEVAKQIISDHFSSD